MRQTEAAVCLAIIVSVLCWAYINRNYGDVEKSKSTVLGFFYPGACRIADVLQKLIFGTNNKFKSIKNITSNISVVLLMLVISGFICLVTLFVEGQNNVLEGNVLNRPQNVENPENINLNVYKSGDEVPINIELNLETRKYSEEEVYENFENAAKMLPNLILGENESLDKITSDLKLVNRIEAYKIDIEWICSDYKIISYDGTVNNEYFKISGIESAMVELSALLRYGTFESEEKIEIRILPTALKTEEEFSETVKNVINDTVSVAASSDTITLPSEIAGYRIRYEAVAENSTGVVFIFFIVATVVIIVGQDSQRKKEVEIRKKQMEHDYAEIISKMTLLLGAGMTISRAWEKTALEYSKKSKSGKTKVRFAYEEMLITYYQMKSGLPEIKAYAEFGKRCNMREYLKFGTLLEQNIRKGTKDLAKMLERESMDAFEARKMMARRLGEEAGTKMLIPMGLMLVVVMIIVMIPAFMSFNI